MRMKSESTQTWPNVTELKVSNEENTDGTYCVFATGASQAGSDGSASDYGGGGEKVTIASGVSHTWTLKPSGSVRVHNRGSTSLEVTTS